MQAEKILLVSCFFEIMDKICVKNRFYGNPMVK